MKNLGLFLIIPLFLVACNSEKEVSDSSSNTQNVHKESSVEPAPPENEAGEPEEEYVYTPMALPRFETTDGCLPEPSPRFLGWIESDSLWKINEYFPDYVYLYLVTHLDSVGSKEITYTGDSLYDPRISTQKFANDIIYTYNYYPEKGSSGKMTTKCSDREEFYKVFSQVIYWPDNSWNSDSSEYEADGAGCYYDIFQNSEGYFCSEWSCGC